MRAVHLKLARNHMATTFSFVVSCEQARARAAETVLEEAHRLIERLERELSEFLPESPVSRLNAARPGETVPFEGSARTVLTRSLDLRDRSAGAFDPLAKSPPAGRAAGISITADGVKRHHPETRLGFGAIGKGYALDRARAVIEREGFFDYFLSAGGSSLVLSGQAFPEEPWRWGWAWSKDAAGALQGPGFSHSRRLPIAIGVSGNLEQGEHIRDLASRRAGACDSALFACASATEADALSTALYVLGFESFQRAGIGRPEAAVATANGEECQWNGVFQDCWGSPCESAA